MGKTKFVSVLLLVVILCMLSGCATTAGRKGSSIIPGREATEIWHSYEILPNYHYYYSGPNSQPNFIIGIDDKYHLTSKNWKPVDLTPEMLNKWINYYRPRVGYDLKVYGSFIVDPDGERVGLWYSMKNWRQTGSSSIRSPTISWLNGKRLVATSCPNGTSSKSISQAPWRRLSVLKRPQAPWAATTSTTPKSISVRCPVRVPDHSTPRSLNRTCNRTGTP